MDNYIYTISESLKESILNRVCETSTGYLKVPSDLIKRVRNETGTLEQNWQINAKIQNFVNANS